ncbi:MAG: phosphomethylpyrimidine synthase ThiC [Clostridia bacterium]|nr:phosphomethylpyrimidine synthase ThiC [Clostridia bacterium]
MLLGGKLRGVSPIDIGENAKPIIFTHVGIISEFQTKEELDEAIEIEAKKALRAIELGADAICDVSTNSNMALLHERLARVLDVPFGVVSVYETFVRTKKEYLSVSKESFFRDLEAQLRRGADLLTLHATVFRDDRSLFQGSGRIIPSTSRGGMMMLELLEAAELENPYYTYFDDILKLCIEYGASISLAPMFRPASVVDAREGDTLHVLELTRMAELVKMAAKSGVTIMIEGIGHASLVDIPRLVSKAKELCPEAAYRIMPVATDVAIGFDHISSAIAAATAIQHGADSITCVTRKEHIGIPSFEDTEEGVISAIIAAHIGYSARTGDLERDRRMSSERFKKGCLGDVEAALFPTEIYKELADERVCSMCGEYCPLKKQRNKE